MELKKNIFFLNSLKYIIVSGASKGFNYLLLLYLAIGAYSEQYVTILLLFSLEQLLSLILPLNNPNIIYSKSILEYKLITNKLITNSILLVSIYLVIFLLFRKYFYQYFEADKMIVFFSIFFSMLINSYLVYLTNYYKLVEKHSKALLIQGLLLISFLSIVVSILLINNKVVAFFVGKTIGLFLVLIIVKFLKLNLTKYKFITLNKDELKKIFNLLSVSILGWVSGLGFMNVAKIYSSPEELLKIGYVLTICNVFLLISISINSVYNPLVKKYLIQGDINKTLKIKTNTLLIYLSIALLSFLLYYILYNTINFSHKIQEVSEMIPYSILIFVFSIFQSVVHPFYLINDKFKCFNLINIFSYILWVLIIVVCTYFGYENYIWFLITIYFLKAGIAYVYAKQYFMNKKHKISI